VSDAPSTLFFSLSETFITGGDPGGFGIAEGCIGGGCSGLFGESGKWEGGGLDGNTTSTICFSATVFSLTLFLGSLSGSAISDTDVPPDATVRDFTTLSSLTNFSSFTAETFSLSSLHIGFS